jgi:hypothetical protein
MSNLHKKLSAKQNHKKCYVIAKTEAL